MTGVQTCALPIFINKAGGCVVAMVNDKIIVLLGSKNVRTRIPELEKLIKT